MAFIAPQTISRSGLAPSFAACANGDQFNNSGIQYLHVKNGSGGALNVTVSAVRSCNFGSSHDVVVSVPGAGERLIGPFPTDQFGRTPTIVYSGLTSMTIAVIQNPV